MATLEFKNVSVYYRNKKDIITAVDDVSFSFHDKKINVLIGFSGCGKTSILNSISGYILFDGEIYLNGEDIRNIAIQKRNVSYVDQEIVLYPHLTVYDNIAYPLKLLRLPREEIDIRVRELANELDIAFLLTRKPKYLSIGQQQRVAIARAFAKRPDIIIRQLIKENNSTCIYVSHNIFDAVNLADYIYVMNEGKIIGEYTPEQFLKSHEEVAMSLKADLPHEEESK